MKLKILFTFFITLLYMKINGQITLEHAYDSASTYGVISGNGFLNQLMIIKFEVLGERYVNLNKEGKYISIYDMNHSLLKTISYAGFPQGASNNPTLLYLSEQLFDTDTQMEFMYIYSQGGSPLTVHTNIYKEDGSLIFSGDTIAPLVVTNVPQQQQPIYNTSQGTKMLLSHQTTGQAKVFSLPGTLSTAIAEANGQLMQAQGGQGQFSNLYPNPSNGAVTLQYELPKGEQYGEIILFSIQGEEVTRYKVDGTFKDILLDNTMLPAGTYFYQLVTGKGSVGTKKMIVVK